jgi:hypothetical protein
MVEVALLEYAASASDFAPVVIKLNGSRDREVQNEKFTLAF